MDITFMLDDKDNIKWLDTFSEMLEMFSVEDTLLLFDCNITFEPILLNLFLDKCVKASNRVNNIETLCLKIIQLGGLVTYFQILTSIEISSSKLFEILITNCHNMYDVSGNCLKHRRYDLLKLLTEKGFFIIDKEQFHEHFTTMSIEDVEYFSTIVELDTILFLKSDSIEKVYILIMLGLEPRNINKDLMFEILSQQSIEIIKFLFRCGMIVEISDILELSKKNKIYELKVIEKYYNFDIFEKSFIRHLIFLKSSNDENKLYPS